MKSPLFLISGPSGSGQDSTIEGLEKIIPIERVITKTTRPMRPNESNGHPYWFVSRESFEKDLGNGEFLEYACHYGSEYYGVSKQEIHRVETSGKIGIWKVDWQGVRNIKAIFPNIQALLITAPLDILEARLRRRDTSRSEESLRERMAYSQQYKEHEDLYDFIIENGEGKLNETIRKVADIVTKNYGQNK